MSIVYTINFGGRKREPPIEGVSEYTLRVVAQSAGLGQRREHVRFGFVGAHRDAPAFDGEI
ncbi:MAG: hypothetical protein HXX08_23300 [Chloroflexi bacterium]|uniref:Uncharacterized protein n=1 Tax=Candidatus Chlorohelix allophototropha TaxID=3003348 RepID=A0A8T7M9U7_9CHLR|nr:hypothetical protein [Chloroflexota bacterium]WJW68727.1 hypothetical protein OZ401_004344 [Chloroflexota bacterium L227-S17]